MCHNSVPKPAHLCAVENFCVQNFIFSQIFENFRQKIIPQEIIENFENFQNFKIFKQNYDISSRSWQGDRRCAMRCANCGAAAGALCSRCRGPRYCSRSCQSSHWEVHKLTCTPCELQSKSLPRTDEKCPLCKLVWDMCTCTGDEKPQCWICHESAGILLRGCACRNGGGCARVDLEAQVPIGANCNNCARYVHASCVIRNNIDRDTGHADCQICEQPYTGTLANAIAEAKIISRARATFDHTHATECAHYVMGRGNLPLALELFEEVLTFKMLNMPSNILAVHETESLYVCSFLAHFLLIFCSFLAHFVAYGSLIRLLCFAGLQRSMSDKADSKRPLTSMNKCSKSYVQITVPITLLWPEHTATSDQCLMTWVGSKRLWNCFTSHLTSK